MENPTLCRQTTGFTLIEILLYIAISSFLLLGVGAFITASFQARAEGQVAAEVEQQGQHIMQLITDTIHVADNITAPAAGANGGTLTLAMAGAPLNPTVFALSGNDITMTEGSGSAVALDNIQVNASALVFTNLSRPGTPGVVRVQFTLTYNGNTANRVYNYSKVFYGTASLR